MRPFASARGFLAANGIYIYLIESGGLNSTFWTGIVRKYNILELVDEKRNFKTYRQWNSNLPMYDELKIAIWSLLLNELVCAAKANPNNIFLFIWVSWITFMFLRVLLLRRTKEMCTTVRDQHTNFFQTRPIMSIVVMLILNDYT